MDPFITPTVVSIAAGWALSNSSISKRYTSTVSSKPTTTLVYSKSAISEIKLPLIQPNVTDLDLPKKENLIGNPKDRLFDQIFSYLPSDPYQNDLDEPTFDDLMVAYEFIRVLPDSLKMPKFMKNDFGGIGFYWELGDFYLDVDVEEDSMLSFFAHDRVKKEDICIEPINVYYLDSTWFESNFSRLYGRSFDLAA